MNVYSYANTNPSTINELNAFLDGDSFQWPVWLGVIMSAFCECKSWVACILNTNQALMAWIDGVMAFFLLRTYTVSSVIAATGFTNKMVFGDVEVVTPSVCLVHGTYLWCSCFTKFFVW